MIYRQQQNSYLNTPYASVKAFILKNSNRKPDVSVASFTLVEVALVENGKQEPKGEAAYDETTAAALHRRPPGDTSRLIFRLSTQTRHPSSSGASPVLHEKHNALPNRGERTTKFSRLPDLF